jgi:hypothetical protein
MYDFRKFIGESTFEGIDINTANLKAHMLASGELDSEEIFEIINADEEKLEQLIGEYRIDNVYNLNSTNRQLEAKMDILNSFLKMNGVEAINTGYDDPYWRGTEILYLNAGDTYASTIMLDVTNGRFFIGTVGDFLESEDFFQEQDDKVKEAFNSWICDYIKDIIERKGISILEDDGKFDDETFDKLSNSFSDFIYNMEEDVVYDIFKQAVSDSNGKVEIATNSEGYIEVNGIENIDKYIDIDDIVYDFVGNN